MNDKAPLPPKDPEVEGSFLKDVPDDISHFSDALQTLCTGLKNWRDIFLYKDGDVKTINKDAVEFFEDIIDDILFPQPPIGSPSPRVEIPPVYPRAFPPIWAGFFLDSFDYASLKKVMGPWDAAQYIIEAHQLSELPISRSELHQIKDDLQNMPRDSELFHTVLQSYLTNLKKFPEHLISDGPTQGFHQKPLDEKERFAIAQLKMLSAFSEQLKDNPSKYQLIKFKTFLKGNFENKPENLNQEFCDKFVQEFPYARLCTFDFKNEFIRYHVQAVKYHAEPDMPAPDPLEVLSKYTKEISKNSSKECLNNFAMFLKENILGTSNPSPAFCEKFVTDFSNQRLNTLFKDKHFTSKIYIKALQTLTDITKDEKLSDTPPQIVKKM